MSMLIVHTGSMDSVPRWETDSVYVTPGNLDSLMYAITPTIRYEVRAEPPLSPPWYATDVATFMLGFVMSIVVLGGTILHRHRQVRTAGSHTFCDSADPDESWYEDIG